MLQRLLRVRTAAAACLAGASFFHTRSALLAGDDAAYAYTPPLRLSEVRSAAAKAAALPRVRVPRPLPRVLFVLGGPGAGKGTQCALLASQFGFEHLSAGDLLREERARGGPTAEMIEDVIRSGRIVPTEVTVGLLKAAMARSPRGKFLVDGFPRNFENLQGWVAQMEGAAEVDGLLMYDVPEDVMVARLLERGKTSGRSDDNDASIRLRLRTYADSTVPVIKHFEAQGKAFVINGDRPVAAVAADSAAAASGAVAAEVLAANARLLDAISAGDWATYEGMCDPALTCFEPEAAGLGRVEGLEFHRHAFEGGARARAAAAARGEEVAWSASTMLAPAVTLLGGKAALVTYVRGVSRVGAPPGAPVARVAETRVWKLSEQGAWRLTHLHRSPMPPLERDGGAAAAAEGTAAAH